MSTVPEPAPLPALPLFKLVKRVNSLWKWTERCQEDRVKTVVVAAKDEAQARDAAGFEIYYVNEHTDCKHNLDPPEAGVTNKKFSCKMIAPSSIYTEPTILTVETFFAKRKGHHALWKNQFDKCGDQRHAQYNADVKAFDRDYVEDYESPQYESDWVHSD